MTQHMFSCVDLRSDLSARMLSGTLTEVFGSELSTPGLRVCVPESADSGKGVRLRFGRAELTDCGIVDIPPEESLELRGVLLKSLPLARAVMRSLRALPVDQLNQLLFAGSVSSWSLLDLESGRIAPTQDPERAFSALSATCGSNTVLVGLAGSGTELADLLERVRLVDQSALVAAINSHAQDLVDGESSAIDVWDAVSQTEPDLAAEILHLLQTEESAARWVSERPSELESSPAQLIADGRADAVWASLRKTAHGFVG